MSTTRGIRIARRTWITVAWEERIPGTSTWIRRFGLWLEYGTGEGVIVVAWGNKQV